MSARSIGEQVLAEVITESPNRLRLMNEDAEFRVWVHTHARFIDILSATLTVWLDPPDVVDLLTEQIRAWLRSLESVAADRERLREETDRLARFLATGL